MPVVTLESLAEQIRFLTNLVQAQARNPQPSRPAKRRSPRIRKLSNQQKDAIDVFLKCGRNATAAAIASGISRQAFSRRLARATTTLRSAGMKQEAGTLKPFREPAHPTQQYPTDLRGCVAI